MHLTIIELRALVDVVFLAIEIVIDAFETAKSSVPDYPNQKEVGQPPAKRSDRLFKHLHSYWTEMQIKLPIMVASGKYPSLSERIPVWLLCGTIIDLLVDVVILTFETAAEALVAATLALVLDGSN